jgi:hypothetical protein
MKIAILLTRLEDLARATKDPKKKGSGNTLSVEKLPKKFDVHVPSVTKPVSIDIELLEDHRATVVPTSVVARQIDQFVVAVFANGRSDVTYPIHDPQRTTSVYDFAALVGISHSRARYIVDHTHASFLPTYSAVTQKKAESSRFVKDFGGLYTLYRHDRNAITQDKGYALGVLVRCALSIRYPLPYKPAKSEKQGRSRIRCRLTIPNYSEPGEGKYHYYDGSVGISNPRWLQFLFQRRPEESRRNAMEDLILMYTNVPDLEADAKSPSCEGVMLTQNQDHAARFMPSVSSVVIMRNTEYKVVENKGAKPEYLEPPFQLVPDQEHEFVDKTTKILDLTAASEWDDQDRAAILALHESGLRVNVHGLHL